MYLCAQDRYRLKDVWWHVIHVEFRVFWKQDAQLLSCVSLSIGSEL